MFVADDERNLVAVNAAACAMLQRSREEMLSSRIDDISAPSARRDMEDRWRELRQNGIQYGRWPLSLPDGRAVETEYAALADIAPSRHLAVAAVMDPEDDQMTSGDGRQRGEALSVRETEILVLLALGYTGPEIARRLFLAIDTIRSHIKTLKVKLGARTLAHLVAIAMTSGILPEGERQKW
jgi:DNA-binding CsgD family transcriptional regulator